MSYSRRLKEQLSLLYAAVERDWLRSHLIHVDGSAFGNSATTGYLRTAKRLAAYKEVGGTLRTHFGAPNAACLPRLRSVQSLPEKAESLAPLGQMLSGGIFFGGCGQ
jgi:hypothetical protein